MSLSPRTAIMLTVIMFSFMLAGCERPKPPGPPPAPEVATINIQPEKIVLMTELPGRTSAYRISEVRPQVNGIILKRLFREGSDVKQGQELYLIDPAPFQAAYDNARAALNRSEAALPAIKSRADRYRGLLSEKAVSQQDYDDRESALRTAEADIEYWKAMLETAKINLQYTRVTAPISGRIGKSNVTDGALVTAYQPLPLATIQQIDPIHVDVPQSTSELLRLRRNLENGRLNQNGKGQQDVVLLMEDGSQYPIRGMLKFRDVTVDPSTGSVILRIVFSNPDALLLPGMFVRARIQEGTNEQAILVPQQAVSRDPKGNPSVFIVGSNDLVEQRTLKLDRAIGPNWLVSEGLAPGERVIVEGLQRIRPGAPVRAVALGAVGKDREKTGKGPKPRDVKEAGGN